MAMLIKEEARNVYTFEMKVYDEYVGHEPRQDCMYMTGFKIPKKFMNDKLYVEEVFKNFISKFPRAFKEYLQQNDTKT